MENKIPSLKITDHNRDGNDITIDIDISLSTRFDFFIRLAKETPKNLRKTIIIKKLSKNDKNSASNFVNLVNSLKDYLSENFQIKIIRCCKSYYKILLEENDLEHLIDFISGGNLILYPENFLRS